MKISYNWLKEFVDVPVDARTLAEELTNVGIQLENAEEVDGDTILNFEVTVNRPDCLSMLGIAREVAAIFGGNGVKMPALHTAEILGSGTTEGGYEAQGRAVRIVLEDTGGCPRYCGQLFTGVRVGQSPAWLSARLEALGVRSINNVVDITNMVMVELGQPLHAFDYDRLAQGTIRVRRGNNERLMMIDGKERLMDASILVIADAVKAQAVGGVMGGMESEVSEGTTTVLLESAYFEPGDIRSARRKLELNTEASYRFERGVDYQLQATACKRAALLLEELAGAKAHPVLDVSPLQIASKQIELRPHRIEKLLGTQIDAGFVRSTLTALGFREVGENIWEVPSFRVDMEREIDLIEEVARIYGYNRFPETLPAAEKKYQPDYPTYDLERLIARYLRGAGVDEASTLSFVGPETPWQSPVQRVKLVNPLSEVTGELRSSILPNLVESVQFNIRHRNEEVRLFEIGRVFLPEGEKVAVGIAMLGDFGELKGIVENAFPALDLARPSFEEKNIILQGRRVGTIDQYRLESHAVQVCEFMLSDLVDLPKRELRYQAIVTFPVIERDVTFLLDETIRYAEMEKVFADAAIAELRSYRLLYRYQGENIPAGKVSITFRLVFQGADRTLTSQEVDRAFERLVADFQTRFNAERR